MLLCKWTPQTCKSSGVWILQLGWESACAKHEVTPSCSLQVLQDIDKLYCGRSTNDKSPHIGQFTTKSRLVSSTTLLRGRQRCRRVPKSTVLLSTNAVTACREDERYKYTTQGGRKPGCCTKSHLRTPGSVTTCDSLTHPFEGDCRELPTYGSTSRS